MDQQEVARSTGPDGHVLETRTHEGIDVTLDVTYARSWEGLAEAARMQSGDLSTGERFLATIGYYGHVCPNIDDVVAALRAARPGEEVTGSDVIQFVASAFREATPKN